MMMIVVVHGQRSPCRLPRLDATSYVTRPPASQLRETRFAGSSPSRLPRLPGGVAAPQGRSSSAVNRRRVGGGFRVQPVAEEESAPLGGARGGQRKGKEEEEDGGPPQPGIRFRQATAATRGGFLPVIPNNPRGRRRRR